MTPQSHRLPCSCAAAVCLLVPGPAGALPQAHAQGVHVLVLDADPFRTPGARVLGAYAAPDWTSDPQGLPVALSVRTEQLDPGRGLLPGARIDLAPLPAGAVFALANQLSADLSVFPGRSLPPTQRDADRNGFDDTWEIRHFGRTGTDPTADADGDGSSNRVEYRAQTNPTDPASRPPWADLVAQWSAENNTLDSTGEFDGSWEGAAAYDRGRSGMSFAFVLGGASFVRIPDAPPLRSLSAFTLAAWIRPDSINEAQTSPILTRPSSVPGVPGYGLEITASGPRLRIASPLGIRSLGPLIPLNSGEWRHVAATWDGVEGIVYLDGQRQPAEPVGTDDLGPLDLPQDHDLLIGFDGNHRSFHGLIDEVVLAGRVLTRVEIEELAAAPPEDGRLVIEVVAPAAGGGAPRLLLGLPDGFPDGAVLEAVNRLGEPWIPAEAQAQTIEGRRYLQVPLDARTPARFFRVRR